MTAVFWIVALALVILGLLGTVLPALPGPVLVFAGLLLAAWIDGFARVGVLTIGLLGILTIGAHLIDLVAAAMGVQRSGASKRAIAGAALGVLAGLFFGLPGLVLGPFVGATLAELTVRRDLRGAGRAGLAAWAGFIAGVVAKLAVAFAMIGIFIAAFLL
jgi:uncharacterized protein YqgC (DUF456 family)